MHLRALHYKVALVFWIVGTRSLIYCVDLTLSRAAGSTVPHRMYSVTERTLIGITEEEEHSYKWNCASAAKESKLLLHVIFILLFTRTQSDVTKPTIVMLESGDRAFVLYIHLKWFEGVFMPDKLLLQVHVLSQKLILNQYLHLAAGTHELWTSMSYK